MGDEKILEDLIKTTKTSKLHMVSFPWKHAIIPLGVVALLGVFKISITAGFTLVIGLCIGSLGEKLGWWDNN